MPVLQVANLLLESQRSSVLREKILNTPESVAIERNLPWNVIQAAWLTLRQGLSTKSIWY